MDEQERPGPLACKRLIMEYLAKHGSPGASSRAIGLWLRDHGAGTDPGTVHRWLSDLRNDAKVQVRAYDCWQLVPEPVLMWDKPERKEPYETWAQYQPDDGPPGAWVPNMSEDDKRSWKAKLKGQRSEALSVEIRVSVPGPNNLAQVLIVVQESGMVVTSQNGKAAWTPEAWRRLPLAVDEARAAMAAWRREHSA